MVKARMHRLLVLAFVSAVPLLGRGQQAFTPPTGPTPRTASGRGISAVSGRSRTCRT